MNDQFDLMVKPSAGSIASNISDLKAWVESVTEPYIGQVVTDDQAKFAKKDLAELRKLKTALEDERKKAKAIIMEPYTQFEAMYKDAVASLDKAISGIDKQIKEIDELERIRRRGEVNLLICETADAKREGLSKMILQDRVMAWFADPAWYLKSTTAKKFSVAIEDRVDRFFSAISALDNMQDKYSALRLDHYLATGKLSEAIQRAAKAQQDAEAARKLTGERETACEEPQVTAAGNHQPSETPYVTPIADRIFFDIPVEPDDEALKELMHVPAVLVFPKYRKNLIREIMTKLGIKMMKPSSKEGC